MPELPEVETVKNILNPIIKGKKITDIIIYRDKNIVTGCEQFKQILIGKKFLSVERKGKFLLFNVEDDYVILSHLRMEGKYFESVKGKKINQHDIFAYVLDDSITLVYNDVRKFGEVGLYKKDELYIKSPLSKLGPEPYDVDANNLYEQIKRKSSTIKESIMDQNIISGIGNIYADEVLFATNLDPRMPSNQISLEDCIKIKAESIRILDEAIFEGGSTIKSYHPKEGIDGKMQSKLRAYGRGGLPCFNCGTKLRKITVGGRGTCFCPKCQKDANRPYVLGVTGRIHSGKTLVSKYLESKGYIVFNADQVAKEVYNNPKIKIKIINLLGPNSYLDEKVNSKYIRQVLIAKPELKNELDLIIHPQVFKAAKEFVKNTNVNQKIVLDIPLITSANIDSLCDEILLIDSSLDSRRARLEKEGRDYSSLLKINSSYPFAFIKNLSTYFIENNSSEEDLYKKIDNLNLFWVIWNTWNIKFISDVFFNNIC